MAARRPSLRQRIRELLGLSVRPVPPPYLWPTAAEPTKPYTVPTRVGRPGPRGRDGKGGTGDGAKGVGIKSVAYDAPNLTLTLTDDSTEGPFAVQGTPGVQGEPGAAGRFTVAIYRVYNDGSIPTDAPTGGELTAPADASEQWKVSPPTDWSLTPSSPAAGQALVAAITTVEPATAADGDTPTWTAPVRMSGYRGQQGPKGDTGGVGPIGPAGTRTPVEFQEVWSAPALAAPNQAFVLRGLTPVTAAGVWDKLPNFIDIHAVGFGRAPDEDAPDHRSVGAFKADLDFGKGIHIQIGGAADRVVTIVRAAADSQDLTITGNDAALRLLMLELGLLIGGRGEPGPAGAANHWPLIGSANFDFITVNRFEAVVAGQTPISASSITPSIILGVAVGANLTGSYNTQVGLVRGALQTRAVGDAPALNDAATFVAGTVVALARDSDGNVLAAKQSGSTARDATPLYLYRAADTDAPQPAPHISTFELTSGDLAPAAGSIAAQVYGYRFAVAQSDRAATVRVVGRKVLADGTAQTGVTLDNVAAGNHHGGTGDVVIPAGVTLAAGDYYQVRLEVYETGQTVPSTPFTGASPVSYQDVRITAHAPAAANYHVGYVAYDSGDSGVADTLARITDFSNDTATSAALPATMPIALPSSGEYQVYLAAKASEPQPAGFTLSGLNATNAFYPAQDKTIASVAYKFYILKPINRLTAANNGEAYGVTS